MNKAIITHSSVPGGYSTVILQGISENILTYFANLGGTWRDGGDWIFTSRDIKHVPESLKDEGYEITVQKLL